MKHKGIILAGGSGTRLLPVTKVVTKQLLPIYDKPLIYYPLSVLLLLNIRDILIIVNPHDLGNFMELLGDRSQLGLHIEYKIQPKPAGLPQAFTLGEAFIGTDPVTMILGDNIFYGSGVPAFFGQELSHINNAGIFTFQVKDPQRFGVVEYTADNCVHQMVEKPENPKSNWAMAGLYHMPADAVQKAATLKPSTRGELEMLDLLKLYHDEGRLKSHKAPRGFAWLDTGTPEAMMKAGQYVQVLEERQGIKIACIEEIAYHKGWIDRKQFEALAEPLMKSGYGEYMMRLLKA